MLWGCGGPAVLPTGPAITPGTYVGQVATTTTVSFLGQPPVTETTISQITLTVSPAGLPVHDGKEVAIGATYYVPLGAGEVDLVVSSVMATQDGVTVTYLATVRLVAENTSLTMVGTQLDTYQAISTKQVRYTRTASVSQPNGIDYSNIEEIGILSRP